VCVKLAFSIFLNENANKFDYLVTSRNPTSPVIVKNRLGETAYKLGDREK
jgi:hypothetical protein